MNRPIFVVVGHVNRGKSSIVANLAADDSVHIDLTPGTTRHCRRFPMRVGDQTLYTLVDTPGFERPRQALAWLREHQATTAERRRTVEAFVHEQKTNGMFPQECELLEPILDGGTILYIVDGSKPPSPKYEAEMEILRWTGQPRVALINSIGRDDYRDDWQPLLDQYFNLVRVFNAHEAGFEQRLRLLSVLRETTDPAREPLDRAIRCLIEDRDANFHDAATAIAEMLVAMLTMVREKKVSIDAPVEGPSETLAKRYGDRLRALEDKCWDRLKQSFGHPQLSLTVSPMNAPKDDDLLNVDTWNRLGLSQKQLVATGVATGAAAGGAFDAAVGGTSFLAGALIGGGVGGALAWFAGKRLPKVTVQGFPMGGQLLTIGPMTSAEFPWVVLDRALLTLDTVAQRSHARRDEIDLRDGGPEEGIVAGLPRQSRSALERLFGQLRKRPNEEAIDRIRRELTLQVGALLADRYVQQSAGRNLPT